MPLATTTGATPVRRARAKVAEAITVASTDENDNRSSFSNLGSCVDIFAPGGNITSASNSSNNGSKCMSGTSMAAPHVTGAAALYLAANPTATPQQVRDGLVPLAMSGVVNNPGTGSPNKLLDVSKIGGSGPPSAGRRVHCELPGLDAGVRFRRLDVQGRRRLHHGVPAGLRRREQR